MAQLQLSRRYRPTSVRSRQGSRLVHASRRGARGVAAVECALCVPLVVLLMFGTLSVCSDMYLKQTLTIAAFEGARTGVRRNGDREAIEAAVQNVLDARGVVEADITISPADFSVLQALDEIEVLVDAPTDENTFYEWGVLGSDRRISAKVVMAREFDE